MQHVAEFELALYSTGDLPLWKRGTVRLHVAGCKACQSSVEGFRSDRARMRQRADALPAGVEWENLAAEMTANIHLGLEAGECVTPKDRRAPIFKPRPGTRVTIPWKPAAIAAGVTVLMVAAWWLNMPSSDTQSLVRAFRSIGNGGRDQRVRMLDERIPVLDVSESGRISVLENGGALGMSQGLARPVAVSVSVEGSASARYVDADTGQVTVASVYVE